MPGLTSICENPFGLVLRLVWKRLLFRGKLKTLKTLIDIDVWKINFWKLETFRCWTPLPPHSHCASKPCVLLKRVPWKSTSEGKLLE